MGDWNQFSENNQPNSYVHNGVHELTEVGNFSIDHDAKGNQLQTASGIALAWDQDNRLTDAEDLSFEYDALGRRVSISDGASTKVLVCAGQQLIATYTLGSPASNPTSRFVYASYIDEPVVMLSGSQQYYYSRNQQYSITALTKANGIVVERYAYDAYGNTLVMSAKGKIRAASDVDNPFTFTGRYLHPEIGLLYFRTRYFDPSTGDFISRDPLEYVDGMSLYRGYFVPNGTDPSGSLQEPPAPEPAAIRNCETRNFPVGELVNDSQVTNFGNNVVIRLDYSVQAKAGSTYTICEACCGEERRWNGKAASLNFLADVSITGSVSGAISWNGFLGAGIITADIRLQFSASIQGPISVTGNATFCPPLMLQGNVNVCSTEIGNLTLRSSITSSGSVAGFTASATVAGEGRYPIKMCGSIDLASGTISGLRPTLVGQPTGGISLTTTLDRPFRGERVRTRCLLGTCS